MRLRHRKRRSVEAMGANICVLVILVCFQTSLNLHFSSQESLDLCIFATVKEEVWRPWGQIKDKLPLNPLLTQLKQ